MKFPVDLLADVSQTELERLAHNYMNDLLYGNPDSPEHLTLPDSTQVTIDISSVGFVPLYGSNDKQKILALFSPSDPLTAVALYLLDQWWPVDDILKTADPARVGPVEVEKLGERIVLYILNRVIYRAKEMSSEELPFLCHGEKDNAKILWNDGEAVGFYSVKPSGSFCNSFLTRSYQLPVMDSIFVRKCQRGKGFGLQMLEDFVLSFKGDCLGLRYPLTKSMYKVCEKYLCQYPGDTDLLWEVESIGGPNQRTNIASKIQAMDQSALSKSLSFTEESLVITEMTEKEVVMEAITTQIKEAESVECTVEIVEEMTVLSATLVSEAEVPLTAWGRSSGSKQRKMAEKNAEDKSGKLLRIEDIEAETPKEEQVSTQQETELHIVSELLQTEGMISMALEEKGQDVVDTASKEADMMSDQPVTALAPQNLEEPDVTSAPATDKPQEEDDAAPDLNNTPCDSQITVENVASEIEEAEEDYQKEDTAVLVVSEVLEVHKEAETLDKVRDETQIVDTDKKSEERVTHHEISLLKYATSEDGETGRTGSRTDRTVPKSIKPVQSKTPKRRSERNSKLEEGVKEETTAKCGGIILKGRTVMNTPTPKCKYTLRSQKICEEFDEVVEENEVSICEVVEGLAVTEEEDQEEMTHIKEDFVAVEELSEEQLEDEQLKNEEETVQQQEPRMEDTLVMGGSTELPDTAETSPTKENVRDESDKEQKDEEVETVMQDKQDVSDEEMEEPPVVQKRAVRGRSKVIPKPTKQSKRQKQEVEYKDVADLGSGGSASEEKADEPASDKQMEEHHLEEQEEIIYKTEEEISTIELTVVEEGTIPKSEEAAVPLTEVNVGESKEVQEDKVNEGETEAVLAMEAEKDEEALSVLRKGRRSAAPTARCKSKNAHTQGQTEEEEEQEGQQSTSTSEVVESAARESVQETLMTPKDDNAKGMSEEEEAPVFERVLRSGQKTVRVTIRSKTTKRHDVEQKEEAGGEESTEEDELAVETRVLRKRRRSAAATARRRSKRACIQTKDEGEEESTPAEETGGEEEEAEQEFSEEKGEEVEKDGKNMEMEKDEDVEEEEAESVAMGESGEGDAEQMKDASTGEAAVVQEQNDSINLIHRFHTDTVKISSAEVEVTNSAEEEETTITERSTAATEVGSDTATVTDTDTVAVASETVIPDTVLREAAVSAVEEPQEKDSGSEIPKLQKATVILVDIKTTCHHLSVKEVEETPVDRECAAPEKQQKEKNGGKQEIITEKSANATTDAETVEKKELEEDNSKKEKEESANMAEEKMEAEEALVIETRVLRSGRKTVEASCKSKSRSNQQRDDDSTVEGITEKEVDEADTGTDEVEGGMEAVAKDAVIVTVPVEEKQPAVSEICVDRETDIPAADDAEENLPLAEEDETMSLEEEEALVKSRALRNETKTSTAIPSFKTTRKRKQGDAQKEEISEETEEPAVITRTLRRGRISTFDTPKSTSRTSHKQILEEEQKGEEKSKSVEESGVEEEEAAKEAAVEKTDKEIKEKAEVEIVEKFEEEAASEREESLESVIDMEEGEVVAEQGQDVLGEQSQGVSQTFAKMEVEASGEECYEGKPIMGEEEVELLPVAVSRSLKSGGKMSNAPPNIRSRRVKKEQDEEEEGGASAEKNTDGLELAEEPPTEWDEEITPEQDKTQVEKEELVTAQVEKRVSEDDTMEMTEEEENITGVTAAADDLVQEGETDTLLTKPTFDSTVLPTSEEEATLSAEEQQSEEMAPKLSDLQGVTMLLVDLQKTYHDIQEETAAAEEVLCVQKTAAETKEEEREETMAQEKVPGSPVEREKTELEKVIVEEEGFEDKVEAVTVQDSKEDRAEETAKEVKAKGIIDEEQEPTVPETRTQRSKKQAAEAKPSTKLARRRQKKGQVDKETALEIQKEEPAVQGRILRRGRRFIPFAQKCTTKRTHKQLQEGEEEKEGEEELTAVKGREEEGEQRQIIDQQEEWGLEERDATQHAENIEAEMGIEKEVSVLEEAVIKQDAPEEGQADSSETVADEVTEASVGQHADEGKTSDVAGEAFTTQDTVEGQQSTSTSKGVESAAVELSQETPLTPKDDNAKGVFEEEESPVIERVMRSGQKTVRAIITSTTTKRHGDEQEEEAGGEERTEENEPAGETRVLRKGRRSAAATVRHKSKRAGTQTEDKGEEETTPAEVTGGEEEEAGQELSKEKGEEIEEEGKIMEMEKEEEAESVAMGESDVGDAEQMKDALTEKAAVLEEQNDSMEDVDEIGTDMVKISSAKVEETNSAEEEPLPDDASVEAEEEAPAMTTRALRSKIKTSHATPSRRSRRQKDQGGMETQQQEEENPEEDLHQLTDDLPRRSARKRPRVDYKEKGEADERGETEAATDKEEEDKVESDEDTENKKSKCPADEPKDKLGILHFKLDTDGEVKTAGINQDEQNMSEQEIEPIVIGKRVLRGRSVPAVIITPHSKSRRHSAKVQKAEESLTEEGLRSALKRKSNEVTSTRKSKRLSRV